MARPSQKDLSTAITERDSFDQPYLVRFNNLDLNFTEIVKAELVLVSGFASANADSPEPWTIHRMLQDWNLLHDLCQLDKDGNPLLSNPPSW